MTRPRPNVKRQWFTCPSCTLDFMDTSPGLCPQCGGAIAKLRGDYSQSTRWRDVPRTGRWFVYGLLLLALLFLLRVAGDLVTMVKGWSP